MNKYYVLKSNGNSFVKDAEFFEQQGGLTEPWGKNWRPVFAADLEAARALA